MKATRQPKLREALERLAEAADSILQNTYPCNGKGPSDLKEEDSYFQSTPERKLTVHYQHRRHRYTVQVSRH